MEELNNPYATPEIDDAVITSEGQYVSKANLSTVAQGLTLIYTGICVSLILIVLGVAAQYVLPLAQSTRVIAFAPVTIGVLLIAIGYLFCVGVPKESGARKFVLMALACQATGWLLPYMTASTYVRIFGLLADNVVTHVFFAMFLGRLSTFIERADLAQKARNLLVALLITLTLNGLGYVAFAPLMVASALLFLFAFILYANLVNDLRIAVRQACQAVQ